MRYQHFKGEPNVCRSTPGPRVTALVSLAATLILALSRLAEATTINANSVSLSDVAAAIASATDGDIVIIPGGMSTWTRTLSVKKAIELRGAGVGSTIIRDAVQGNDLISWTLAAGYLSRLTGIEFQDGGRTSTKPGLFYVSGSNTNGSQFRMDHCKLNNLNGYPIFDTVVGVIDHNSFVVERQQDTMFIYGARWNNQNYGDGSWAALSGYGSSQFLFIEDNDFVNNTAYLHPMTDAYNGARFVLRHNTAGGFFVATHGTESTGRGRGTRCVEVYQNTFDGHNLNALAGGTRSGGFIVHDNTLRNYWTGAYFHLNNYRSYYPFAPWGGADGTNVWDVNEPNAFFTGTAASNSSGTTVTVSGSPNWTTNQWVGYALRRTSNICGSNSLSFGEIRGNTSNTITYTDSFNGNPPTMAFCAGDTLEIRKVDHAIDQPGRALGSLITGDTPIRPPGWNDQVTEPCYSWNNFQGAAHVNLTAHPSIRLGIHYFNDTPMPGYTPYVYPHPLVTGGALPLLPSPAATRTSQRKHWGKKQEKTKELERKPGKKAKQNPANEMAESQEKLGN